MHENLIPLADELGHVKAQQAELTERERAIKRQLLEAEVTELEGDLFRVTVSRPQPTRRIDWAAIVERLNPSRQLVQAHTRFVENAPRVNCRARKGK